MIGFKLFSTAGFILLVAFMTVLLSTIVLIALSQMGIIAFTGGGWIISTLNLIRQYLGYSILFFIPALICYAGYCLRLKQSLSRYSPDAESGPEQMRDIRYYSAGMDVFITLFFAIGVIFTAWGLQNALVSALHGVDKAEAARLGAWGILDRLVENGILIALWTTIVGGAGGYMMRLFKFIFVGPALTQINVEGQEKEKKVFFEALESIKAHVKRIEQKMSVSA